MFDSALFHKTDDFSFKKGYLNRRINLTLLFGRMVLGDGRPAQRLRGGEEEEDGGDSGDGGEGKSGAGVDECVVGGDVSEGGAGEGRVDRGGGAPKLQLR